MAQTACAVASSIKEKTVVFVGAFLPAACKNSDADFNLGFALAAVQTLPAGVYIAMNGRLLPATAAVKNYAAGRFEMAKN
jgi:L-asparaginase